MKKAIVLVLQLVVSAGLLAWMFRKPEFRADVMEIFSKADAGWMTVAALVAGVGIFLGFVRWGIFLKVVGISIPPWHVFRIAAVGLFFNSFLPGAVGGDAIKAGWLASRGANLKDAVLSVLMDRISGIGALVLCSGVFIGLRFDWLMRSPVVAAMIHMVFLYLGCVLALLIFSFVISARGAVSRIPEKFPAKNLIVKFSVTYSLSVSRWRETLLAAGISVIMLLAYFLTFYFSALALGVGLPVLDFLAFMPSVDILAALPISVGGFGVREGAFVTLLGQLNSVPAAAAVSISFAGALLNLLWGCVGLLLLPGYQREKSR